LAFAEGVWRSEEKIAMHGLYTIKPAFQRTLRPVEDWLVARRVHPDRLTLAALGVALIGGAALALSPVAPGLLLLVSVAALARLALNALDGLVARRLGLARPWGEVVNELGDRLADLAFFGGLLLRPEARLELGAAALAAMLLSSYVGLLGKAAGGRRQYGGVLGKADRMLLLALAAPMLPVHGALVVNGVLALTLVGALATLAQRLRAVAADLA
jgi:CDP-diacylglycerol--glycerol-3-phosphate 3-phosphatidyltransferase